MRYVPVDGTMLIDPESARNLELVGNIVHQKSTHSLFGLVECHSSQINLNHLIAL